MRNKLYLSIALLLATCSTLLVLQVLDRPIPMSVSADSLPQTVEFGCHIETIQVTAELGVTPGVSDTHPGSDLDRNVYFANVQSGVITLTVTLAPPISETTCAIQGSPAFSRTTAHTRTAIMPVTTTVLTYPLGSHHGVTATLLLSSSQESSTGTVTFPTSERVTLTFTQDIAGPLVDSLALTTTEEYLYPSATTLYYTDTNNSPGVFAINGRSTDTVSGLSHTYFSSADMDSQGDICGDPSPAASALNEWSVEYCLRGLPEPGWLTATSFDRVGNVTPVTFTYTSDSAVPDSLVSTTVTESIGAAAIRLDWHAQDVGCGVETVALYYRIVPEQSWTHSETGTGPDGTFTFTPSTFALTGSLDYEFTSVAADHLGNTEHLPGAADTTVTVHPVRIYLPLVIRNYPPQPDGRVIIEDGISYVYDTDVTLVLSTTVTGDVVVAQRLRNDGENWSAWEPYTASKPWTLVSGSSGLRTVYAQFQGGLGGISEPVSGQIYLAWNGDFEAGWDYWAHGGEFSQTIVTGPTLAQHGDKAALLGNPDYENVEGVPVGGGRVWQTFGVPSSGDPEITLWYHIYTYDVVWGSGTNKYYDSFEIYINTLDWTQATDPDSDDPWRQTRCRDQLGVPDTQQPGLVFCDGNPSDPGGHPLIDLGWRSVTLDLSAFKGQEIVLYPAIFNRQDGWFNTWVYVDYVSVDW